MAEVKLEIVETTTELAITETPTVIVLGNSGPQGAQGVGANTINGAAPIAYSTATGTISIDQSGFSHIGNLDYAQFDTTTTATGGVGKLLWNDTDGTLEFQLKGGLVTLQIGQEEVVRVRNNTGAPLLQGQAVYITSATGGQINVTLASNDTEAHSSKTLGILTEDIANGQQGYCTTQGLVRGLNTSTLTEGATVWLGTNGGLTTTRPTAPANSVVIGVCVVQSQGAATNGSIFVRVINGFELDELHNVLLTNPTNNQALIFESASGLWKNKTVDYTWLANVPSAFTPSAHASTHGSVGSDPITIAKTQVTGTAVVVGDLASASVGTADYSTTSGTAIYSTTSGTATYATTSGTAAFATASDTTGTASYATNAGTAIYATTAGTATYANTSGTAVFATTAGSAANALTLGDGLSGTSYNGSAAVTAAVDSTIPRLTASQTFTGAQTLVASGSAVSPLIVRGTTSQSAPLQEWRDASNNLLFSIPANTTTPMTSSYAFTLNNNLNVFPGYDTNILTVRAGVSNPTFDMLRFRNSIGTHIAGVSATGQIYTGATAILANTQLYSVANATTTVGIVTRGAASQTADLLQTQNSAATNLISVTAGGSLIVNPGTSGGTTSSLLGNTGGANNTTANFAVISSAAASIPLVVRGAASQSGNLIQTQSSTGAVNFRVESNGAVLAPTINTTNGFIGLLEGQSGGDLRIFKKTSSPGSPGASGTRLYFLDGTISGTLKMVLRSGASGEEQTLFDNIPQTSGTTAATLLIKDAQFGSGSTYSFGGGAGIIGIANATTVPTTNPTGGGVLYAEGGALKWRGSSGTITTIANA